MKARVIIWSVFAGFTLSLSAEHPPAVVPVLQERWKEEHEGMVADARARADKIQVVFIGDSITARWTRSPGEAIWATDYAPLGDLNLGISADGTQHVLWRLQHGVLDSLHPKMFLVMIGTNNLRTCDPDAVAYGVWSIVAHLRKTHPEARVLVQGIFPRSELNEKVPEVNDILSKFDDGKMVKYIYFGDKFLTPDGALNKSIFTDGTHPETPEGFRIWNESIQPVVQEWLRLDPIKDVPPPPFPLPVPSNTTAAIPECRNDFLYRHNRIVNLPQNLKDKCQLVFLGGTIMRSWDRFNEIYTKEFGRYGTCNASQSSANPGNILWQLENGVLGGMQPKVVVIDAQDDAATDVGAESAAAGAEAIVGSVRKNAPGAKILLLGAFPVGEKPSDPRRAFLAKYNERLSALADGQSVFYLGLGASFLEPDGSLLKDAAPHRLNANKAAYKKWADGMKKLIGNLLNP